MFTIGKSFVCNLLLLRTSDINVAVKKGKEVVFYNIYENN